MTWSRLGIKVTLAAGATALVLIGGFAVVSIRAHRRDLLESARRHANQLSEAVKAGTEYDMLLNQRERVHETIRRMGNEPGIERIRVLNKSGAVIYSSDESEIGRMLDKSAESCTKCHLPDRVLERLEYGERTRVFQANGGPTTLGVINPIYNAPTCWTAACHVHPREQRVLGVLDVTLPLDAVERDIRRAQTEVGALALFALAALSLVIGLVVRNLVGRPVQQLLEATRRVSSGDLSAKVSTYGGDEVGQLARAFNAMTRRLSEARLQLFQQDKLASVGRLAAGVAHEINNPLTGVLTYATYLQKRAGDHPEIQEDLAVIVRETLRSREIVKSLLDFARQSVPRKREADVNEILRRAIEVVESQLAANRVRVVERLQRDLPRAVVDANQIQQVAINLLVNASDAMKGKGGEVTVASNTLRLSPRGNILVRRAFCPKRHSLIDERVRIGGIPSIGVKARAGDREFPASLNPVYGGGEAAAGAEADEAAETEFLCPECSTSLIVDEENCPRCGSPVYAFEAPPRGRFEGCVRRGCGWQRWQAVDESGMLDFVEFSVRDTGCGITEDDLPKIFEPFYTTKGQQGTGLGLAVVWGIVDNHDGTIRAERNKEGGTTFVVRIPREP
jgi:two-component system NtrC family sensor kinase